MASDHERDQAADLELPSLFGRRRKKKAARDEAPETPAGAPSTEPGGASDAGTPSAAPAEATTEELPPTARPVGAGAPTQPLRPVPGASRRPPTAPPPPPADARPPRPTAPPPRPPRPAAPPPRRSGPDMTWDAGAPSRATPPAAPATPPAAPAPAPATPAPTPVPVAAGEQPAAARESGHEPGHESGRGSGRGALGTLTAKLPSREQLSAPSVRLSLPRLPPRAAAALVGVLVALTGVLLTWLSLQACTSVRGVSSCGGIGLLAIVLTLVVQVAVATVLLGALGVAQARSTAVLGVGLASFVAMVLLYASVPGPWLSAALVVLTPAAFVAAEGVTSGRWADTEPPT